MTVIPRQTKSYTCCVNYCFTSTPEAHARAVMDQLGYENTTYGPLMHDLEYQLRLEMFIWSRYNITSDLNLGGIINSHKQYFIPNF